MREEKVRVEGWVGTAWSRGVEDGLLGHARRSSRFKAEFGREVGCSRPGSSGVQWHSLERGSRGSRGRCRNLQAVDLHDSGYDLTGHSQPMYLVPWQAWLHLYEVGCSCGEGRDSRGVSLS